MYGAQSSLSNIKKAPTEKVRMYKKLCVLKRYFFYFVIVTCFAVSSKSLGICVEYVRTGEISDFRHVQEQAYFSELCCDQTSGHSNNQWVPNERFGQDLSIETLCFPVPQIFCLLHPVKVGIFQKIIKVLKNHNFYQR